MPKRKITLDEAFAVFEAHGLQVEVKSVKEDEPVEELSSFLEQSEVKEVEIAEQVSSKLIKITLFASHTIGHSGEFVKDEDGVKHIVNNGIETYGPGVVTVPSHLAQHLLHADMLARRADERMLERNVRQYVVVPRRTANGVVNCARHISNDSNFDMSGLLAKLGDNEIFIH